MDLLSLTCQVQGSKLPQNIKFNLDKLADPMAETNFFQEEKESFIKHK